jgi:hypothetical protein
MRSPVAALRPPAGDGTTVDAFLRRAESRWERIERALGRSEWSLYIGRGGHDGGRWQRLRHRWLSDPALLPFLRQAARRASSALIARRLELFARVVAEVQVEQHPPIVRIRSAAQRAIARFRPLWKGRRVDRAIPDEALRHSRRRPERRAAYYVEERLYRRLGDDLRRLVDLRNARARELGFRSFPEYRLRAEGLSVSRLLDLIDTALRGGPRRLRAIRERFQARTGRTDWFPWDLEYSAGDGPPDRAFPADRMLADVLAGVRRWGFRPSQLAFRVDWHDTPAGGMEVSVDPPHDVRVVATAQTGWTYRGVLFHEVGHAIHARSVRAPSPWLSRPGSLPGFGSLCEGIGALFESIPTSREWLSAQRGLDAETIERAVASRQESELMWMVFHADRTRAEIDLYENPRRDPSVGRLRFLRAMFGYDRFRPLAPANSFTLDAPLYLPSYVLATLFAAQVEEAMLDELDGPIWPNRRVGPWLTERWLRHGARNDWIPWVRETTGRPLGAAAFRRSVGLR